MSEPNESLRDVVAQVVGEMRQRGDHPMLVPPRLLLHWANILWDKSIECCEWVYQPEPNRDGDRYWFSHSARCLSTHYDMLGNGVPPAYCDGCGRPIKVVERTET